MAEDHRHLRVRLLKSASLTYSDMGETRQQALCSQDQWDIYKLDPEYDCTVYPAPQLSTIMRRKVANANGEDPSARSHKRAWVQDISDDDLPMPGNLKKSRPATIESESDDATNSDDEVEMIVETGTSSISMREARRKRMEENRKHRRKTRSFRTPRARRPPHGVRPR